MNPLMTPLAYLAKADRAVASASQLLAASDHDGACNRAYYAMFDAAHAALCALPIEVPVTATKTHRGLIAAFGQHLVLGGHVPGELGASLNKVERLRRLADYTGDPVSAKDALWATTQASLFVAAIRMIVDRA